MTLFNNLICPLDHLPLDLDGNSLRCSGGHVFDIAKSGYINLLPVHKKHSKDPGDSKEMVSSRKLFLNSGVYNPIVDALNDFLFKGQDSLSILDAGCGDGYYLSRLEKSNNTLLEESSLGINVLDCVGMDISKWAITTASKRSKSVTWVVGSNANIPTPDARFDVVICAFGFPVLSEFQRVLKLGGTLILVESGQRHLIELREILYPTIKEHRQTFPDGIEGFSLDRHESVNFEFSLGSKEEVGRLLSMTPHMHKAPYEGRQRAKELEKLNVTADVVIRSFTRS